MLLWENSTVSAVTVDNLDTPSPGCIIIAIPVEVDMRKPSPKCGMSF